MTRDPLLHLKTSAELIAEAERLERAAQMGTGGADIDAGDAAEMRADMRRRAAELREKAKGC